MTNIFNKIKDKNIVIWGVGIRQTDLEGLYSFPKILYYVDDYVADRDIISVSKEKIYSSPKLADEAREDLVIIVCDEDQDDAIAKLDVMGYGREYYILWQELLFDYNMYQRINRRKISVWGTGGSYFFYESEIKSYLPKIDSFIVTNKSEDSFQEKQVFSAEEYSTKIEKSFIIVTSVYYKDIYSSLLKMGLHPGKDFIHMDTMRALGQLSTRTKGDYQFDDRQSGERELLIVLAGYKKNVWEGVFGRLQAYVPADMDVCIITSGLVEEELRVMCKNKNWSYLSTVRNNVSLALNLAVSLHPEAEYIYKMDEDIFVTDGVFETMKTTYFRVESESRYKVGFVAPLVPVNGYSYVRLLEIFDAAELWEKKFGILKYSDCCWNHKIIQMDPEAARFMWGEGNPNMDDLDKMQEVLKGREFQYSVCPIRYSIGFILFHRDNWMRMETFPVLKYLNIGADEEYLCQFCMMQGKAIVIAENAVAGHLSYGPQNEKMERYYFTHKEKFLV